MSRAVVPAMMPFFGLFSPVLHHDQTGIMGIPTLLLEQSCAREPAFADSKQPQVFAASQRGAIRGVPRSVGKALSLPMQRKGSEPVAGGLLPIRPRSVWEAAAREAWGRSTRAASHKAMVRLHVSAPSRGDQARPGIQPREQSRCERFGSKRHLEAARGSRDVGILQVRGVTREGWMYSRSPLISKHQ